MKTRIISAIVLIAIFVPLIIIGGIPFSITVGIVSALAFKEVIDLRKKEKDLPSLIKVVGIGCLLLLIFLSHNDYLLNLGIDLPLITNLIIQLNLKGYHLDTSINDIDDLVEAIGGELHG